MLTKQQKDQWIKDLRSGEFKQCERQLYNPNSDSYCCLGVLASRIAEKRIGRSFFFNDVAYDGDLLGLDLMNINLQYSLISMNDFRLLPFEDIADYIEENLHVD